MQTKCYNQNWHTRTCTNKCKYFKECQKFDSKKYRQNNSYTKPTGDARFAPSV